MITSITVDGFKSLSKFHLALKPGLNILVGPNGSGKTNILSFFEFLSALIDKDPSEATNCLGGAGAVFRRLGDTYQPTIFAKVTGCYPIDEASYRIRGVKAKKGLSKFSLYEYSFKILFSNELESVVFASQQLRYRHVNRFIDTESDGFADNSWDFDIETRLEANMSVTTKVKSLKGEVIDYFPFFHQGKEGEMVKEAEGFLSRMNSAYTSLPSLLMRFTPVLHSLTEDLAGGQTYNIIPSKVKMLEESAKPPGISSDGSGLSSTLYSLKKRSVESNGPMWSVFSGTRSQLKRPSLDTLTSYFQLANSSIEDIDVNSDTFSNQIRVTFKIRSGDYAAEIPLSLMSDGTLKWLTLITAALTAPSVFSIEEPENYLHPTIQGQFVQIIREILFTERVFTCTLMTTHSETLLNHCKPSELVVLSLEDGKSVAVRCADEHDISDEIARTGFGLGYYYIAGALQK